MKKLIAALVCATVLPAYAQSGSTHGADHKGMDMKSEKISSAHKASGTVTKVDAAKKKVTIKHGPVQSLNWPGMTMVFVVKDPATLDKLAKDKKVEFEFVQQGKEYVITSVK